jgi:probable F420-dependent oxidoreductase
MLVDGGIGMEAADAAATARRAEEDGFDGLWCAETAHDPFLPLLLGAEHTERITLGTAIAVAFARNPMTTAMVANDLQGFSNGRFIIGLGSQIKPHITKRYSMPWSHPAARMREFVLAMRAIWDYWNNGAQLSFRGEFYTHTLASPMFTPAPNPFGAPRVFVAAVGELMTEVVGEVGDGLLAHGFTTERYMREVTLPALERGLSKSGRSIEGFDISYPAMLVTGATDSEIETAKNAVKSQLAFYGSTPAYRPVLDLHGWGDLQPELNTLSKNGKWGQMAELIDDDVLDAFAVTAAPDEVAKILRARFGDMVTRVTFYAPYRLHREQLLALIGGFRSS